ncbi:T-complex protein 11-domain-containing protein [Kockovaella imperatae]|uniref:T-complex protein 11-domain-containing protein n=1 Tax=Kockovaella imperatae TaxID=4999 RepID=A0A1Y1UDU7_9TREE|nr:T-complex protein 11-domain-containing protein [Kockovaella imperatae]ORX36169.1 T-complex protein 11-domain-containing protein [Kockovaella imperatae]
MDQNQVPSSPLQQHRPTSSQSSSEDRPNDALACTTSPPQSWSGQPAAPSTFAQWQGEASTSREPSRWEGQVAIEQTMEDPNHCPTPRPPLIEIPSISSALLTSKPLNRASSEPLETALLSRKRGRSLSLPTNLTPPLVKKHKSVHTVRLASAPSSSIIKPIPSFAPPPKIPVQVLVASRQPPVTNSSLKSLDAKEILRNPQLRHDLLFDSLAFRPVMASAPGSKNSKRANDAKTSSIVADMYWDSIEAEITTGCRCVRWQVDNPNEKDLDASVMDTKRRETTCICGKFRLEYTESQWWESQQARWSSRIPELVRSLRDLLISLMGSTTPCPDPYAHTLTQESAQAHERSCPTVTHALIPELCAALDPEFLTIQARRRLFPLGIFSMLGEAMKVHCAPIRDAMIEDMVQTANSGNAAQALKKCFACAEVMKLDIANHQVHTLRPHLWKTAVKDELSAFAIFVPSLSTSVTRKWIRDASMRVLSSTSPSERSELLKSRFELVSRSLAEGFMDLVFSDFSPVSWPPIVQSRLHGAASVQLAEGTETGGVILPESFKMDSRRIKNFNADVIDLSILHIVMGTAKKLWKRHHPHVKDASFVKTVREDIEAAIMEGGGTLPLKDDSLSLNFVTRVYKGNESAPSVYPSAQLHAMTREAQGIHDFLRTAIRPDSSSYSTASDRVRKALTLILSNMFAADQLDPTSAHYESDPRSPTPSYVRLANLSIADAEPVRSNPSLVARELHAAVQANHREAEFELLSALDLLDLKGEMTELAKNMKRIAGFNLRCFASLYGGKGMVVG